MASHATSVSLCLLAGWALALQAQGQATNRPPRPPREYNARVQMHEVPLGSPVSIQDVEPTYEAPDEPAGGGPVMPQGLPRMPVVPDTPGPARERDRRGADSPNRMGRPGSAAGDEAPSGWGWLADDMMRSRAQRRTDGDEASASGEEGRDRGADQRADEEDDREADERNFVTNGAAEASDRARDGNSSRRSGDAMSGAATEDRSGPGGLWEGGWMVGALEKAGGADIRDRDAQAPDLETEQRDDTAEPREGWQIPAWGLRLDTAGRAEEVSPRAGGVLPEREARDDVAPPVRLGSAMDRSPAFDRAPGDTPGRAQESPWSAPAAPNAFAMPSAQALEPTPIAPPNLTPALPSVAPALPALGGMGTAAEQAPPKVLPW